MVRYEGIVIGLDEPDDAARLKNDMSFRDERMDR